jgi:RNA polymerase sigma factor for flagellar operon FliA
MALRMTTPGYFMPELPTSFHLSSFQQEKVTSHLALVKWVVNRIADRFQRLPTHLDINDLSHSGVLGLIDAVRRFSWGRPNEEEEFKAYAECRIRGQVIDELRECDVLPRSTRDKVKQLKKVTDELRQRLQREPSAVEISAALHVDLEIYHEVRREAHFGKQEALDAPEPQVSVMEGLLKKAIDAEETESPESRLYHEEMKKILADEIKHLSPKERTVVSLYYYDELTLKEIGAVLEITESRVSQIHAQALQKLTKRIHKDFEADRKVSADQKQHLQVLR